MADELELFRAYKTLWKNRTMDREGSEALHQAIDDELNDLGTHPRLRKTKHEKYYQSIRRIVNSQLQSDMKLKLIECHTERLELLTNEESRE
ncbi:hypothetical protein MOB49_00665 [Bacillus haynesii]|uniref:hypothetical protein n=1 Tax=Bacillus TaxID=1386 RepID=UPI0012B97514|nr:hypothetical protein [Bacillus haynesii]TWK24730.1 hypothetical protein CHCC20375_3927 [Bacillus licheniformis]MBU8681907.1 hypothetical protein [Bacillus haynesii]MCY7801541.1 hypothetical protein [Bacillus haynesii]MCY7846851.1 hypothetical protein [Bacillus haynesii]MCY7965586.1 hypothetical protein [Bacillus haynesii]